ncbi:MAG: hypothetical protein AB1805_02975 [Nitrospirota bacterium]
MVAVPIKTLLRPRVYEEKKTETIIHALVDIAVSMKKIYFEILPELKQRQLSDNELRDRIWDIREEMRHIEYHIKDASLTEL